ncbi:hypothetical protein JNB_15038 [Janibacter sp. HTCC2649]|uniref:DUF695 domain-containing protein n=1 Tax=Janibacter sp. HTCC2649 TaxID=313589 RepID=UPI000067197D|nr:DUF695 domain-containing protein [Janibacter sp. HTCC2649]EAP98290.1 hypothetical protein JNB_15038 [Janibacter sp. HTCC2649]
MGIFRRKAQPGPGVVQQQGIDEFWAWWTAEGAGRTAQGIADRDPSPMVEPISARVKAIDPGLAWELGPGRDAAHMLVVSPEGNPDIRAAARRWLRSAPPADATWEYADSRQRGSCDGSLEIGPHRIGFSEVVIGARREGAHLDVTVHHPSFRDLPEDVRQQVTWLALDEAVGENDVETWLGQIAPAVEAPLDGFPLVHLAAVVDGLATEHRDDDGEPTWVLMEGERPSGRVIAMAQVPLRATSAPELDQHVTVSVAYTDRTDEGLPGDGSLSALRAFEDHVAERLGGAGRIVAHETGAGVRTLHFYVDSTGPGASVVRAAVAGWDQGRCEVTDQPDPAWNGVAHLRS